MICKYCGEFNEDDAKRCKSCSADLTQTQAQPQSQTSVQAPASNDVFVDPVPSGTVEEPGKNMAIASLVLGIVGFFCFGIICGILAIVFGTNAKKQGYTGSMATAGIVCGAIALALTLVGLIL